MELKKIDNKRIHDLAVSIEHNQELKHFVSTGSPALEDTDSFVNGIQCLIEICTIHFPNVLHNYKQYEKTYSVWHNHLQDYKNLVKEIQKKELTDKEKTILKKLGYE